MLPFFLLLLGIALLIKSSSITISNCVKLSRATGLSQITIGFMLIALATSLPEFAIAVASSSEGEGILSLGNLIGANITNLTLILGLLALKGFVIKKENRVEIDQSVIFTSAIAIFLFFFGKADATFGLFCIILFYAFFKMVIKNGMPKKEAKPRVSLKALLYLLGAVLVVVISARIVTDSALDISKILGIEKSIIGATILAIGTTLPELSIGLAAIRKGNISIAIGDTVGSIVANMTLILGVASIINPIVIGTTQHILLASLLLVNGIFLFMASRMKFRKKEGIILLAVYAVYMIAAIGFGILT